MPTTAPPPAAPSPAPATTQTPNPANVAPVSYRQETVKEISKGLEKFATSDTPAPPAPAAEKPAAQAPAAPPKTEAEPIEPEITDAPVVEDDDTLLPDDPDRPIKPEPAPEPDAPAPDTVPEGKGLGQLLNKSRKQIKQLEKELTDLRTKSSELSKLTEIQDRLEKESKRREELEKRIELVDYTASEHFDKTYRQPFVAAWKRALADLSQLKMTLPDGTTRTPTEQDIESLARMAPGEFDEAAEALFGKSAARASHHVEEIRKLSDAQRQAIVEAQEQGTTVLKQQREQQESQMRSIQATAAGLYEKVLQSAQAKQQFLQAKEGDDDWNASLDKATKFVSERWKGNPLDPHLSPEQRAEVIKGHVAIRNRAIAYTPMLRTIRGQEAEIKSLKEKLSGYEQSEPGKGDGHPSTAAPAPSNEPIRNWALRGLEKFATHS